MRSRSLREACVQFHRSLLTGLSNAGTLHDASAPRPQIREIGWYVDLLAKSAMARPANAVHCGRYHRVRRPRHRRLREDRHTSRSREFEGVARSRRGASQHCSGLLGRDLWNSTQTSLASGSSCALDADDGRWRPRESGRMNYRSLREACVQFHRSLPTGGAMPAVSSTTRARHASNSRDRLVCRSSRSRRWRGRRTR